LSVAGRPTVDIVRIQGHVIPNMIGGGARWQPAFAQSVAAPPDDAQKFESWQSFMPRPTASIGPSSVLQHSSILSASHEALLGGCLPLALAVRDDSVRSLHRLRGGSRSGGSTFPPTRGFLSGIVAHLARQCGGNVHDHGIVAVTSSGANSPSPSDAARNAADLGSNSHFYSSSPSTGGNVPDASNAWLCYDFRGLRVVPTHYTVRTGDDDFIRSWLIETSIDGSCWTTVDRQEDVQELNARHVAGNYKLSEVRVARLVRLVNIGRNHRRNDRLMISAFEIFGTLHEPEAVFFVRLRGSDRYLDYDNESRVIVSQRQRPWKFISIGGGRSVLENEDGLVASVSVGGRVIVDHRDDLVNQQWDRQGHIIRCPAYDAALDASHELVTVKAPTGDKNQRWELLHRSNGRSLIADRGGEVTVTSSEEKPGCSARNVIDWDGDSFFCSVHRSGDNPNTRNGWICYDFGDQRVIPTGYAIRSASREGMSPRSWRVEVSESSVDWVEIDHQEQTSVLNRRNITWRQSVSAPLCRYIRLVNLEANHRGDKVLAIRGWEIFGHPAMCPILSFKVSGSQFLMQFNQPVVSIRMMQTAISEQFFFADPNFELLYNSEPLTDATPIEEWPDFVVKSREAVRHIVTLVDRDTGRTILDRSHLPVDAKVSDLVCLLGSRACSFSFDRTSIFGDPTRTIGSYARGVGAVHVKFGSTKPVPELIEPGPGPGPTAVEVRSGDAYRQVLFFPRRPLIGEIYSVLSPQCGSDFVLTECGSFVQASFPSQILLNIEVPGDALSYFFQRELTVGNVTEFLVKNHFCCYPRELALSVGASQMEDAATLGQLFPSKGEARVTLSLPPRYFRVQFCYLNHVIKLWVNGWHIFAHAVEKLAALLHVRPAFITISDRRRQVMLPGDDLETSAAGHPEPYEVHAVSNKVHYQVRSGAAVVKEYTDLTTCEMAHRQWCDELGNELRLEFEGKPIAGPVGDRPASEYVRDFQGFREVRVLGRGSTGVVKLLEDPSTRGLAAVKFFDSAAARASDGSSAFVREIDALVRLIHPCVVRIVGYCLATQWFPAQIGTEFAAGGSLREALPTLDDTGKAIVVVGVVLGMKFIHSRGVIHRDLKPANILIDGQGRPKIGDLGSSLFCDTRSTMTSGVGTPLYMAPEMYCSVDYTSAIDVYSFALILYEMFVGVPAFDAALSPYVLMVQATSDVRPPLPDSMAATVANIIRQGWSVDPAARGSFEDIFDALRRIEFKLRPAVDVHKVAEFVAFVDPSAAPAKPPRRHLASSVSL
jgi:hypothetical protein